MHSASVCILSWWVVSVISCLQSVDACVAELFDMFPHTPRMHDMCANVADEDWYEPKDLGVKWTRKQLEKVEEGDEVQRQRPNPTSPTYHQSLQPYYISNTFSHLILL